MTCAFRLEVRLHIDDFFQNFSYLGTNVYANWIHIHKHIHTQRDTGVITIGKICKTDLSKKLKLRQRHAAYYLHFIIDF